ncbi:hypothetical protein FA13DRAFT_1725520 [Coprinellus micaceus]|uniref:Uncharacterized protein n=1 Tax=Coprinellus micaceus TaxID=71717 RepID=A0A4Y7TV93_COPMI|nr:hypothetical protein FA13DRAFT_1725520 [Coprinellus micaceus]
MHHQTTKLSALQPRGGCSNAWTIGWSSRPSATTWETNTAVSVISGHDSYTLPQCHSTERTRLQTKIIPHIGNGTFEQHQLHSSLTCSEPIQPKPTFDPFTDEPSPPAPRTLCPKMAEFLITESFNQNPYPDYGQWDEDKARALMISRFDAINAPVVEQSSSSFELNDFDGEVSSDGYSSDGFSVTFDFFEGPSQTSSTDTTPASPPDPLAPSILDCEHLQGMEALEQELEIKGLDLSAPSFKPASFKKGLNASDLTKAIQSGNLVDLFLQPPSAPASEPSPTKLPTLLGLNQTADVLFPLSPFSP